MEQFITQFGIDWKLLLAQLVNFALLVFILGKYVYHPIIDALDKRRKKIEDGVAFSEKAKSELESIETLKADSMKKAQKQSLAIVKAAEDSAQDVRRDILASADEEKEKIIESGKKLLGEERRKLEDGFYQEASGVVEQALKKVLTKKEFSREEEQLVADALKEIRNV